MNNRPVKELNNSNYEFELFKTQTEISNAKHWHLMSKNEQFDFAKSMAESKHTAELLIASRFNRSPESVDEKIKRIIKENNLLLKKYSKVIKNID